jgi:hypothetical protein
MNSNGPLSGPCPWPNGPFGPWRLTAPSGRSGSAGPRQPAWLARAWRGHRGHGRCGGAAVGVSTVVDPWLDPAGEDEYGMGKAPYMVSVAKTHRKEGVRDKVAMAASGGDVPVVAGVSMVGHGGGAVLKHRGWRRR